MALSFPSNPSPGDTYTFGTRTWTWDGSIWSMQAATLGVASISSEEIQSGAVTAAKIGSDVNVVTVCTSSTRPGSPFSGQVIFETDTKKMQVWDGSVWLAITNAPPDAPTSLSAIESNTSVAISFTPGADNGAEITNYKYAISTDGGVSYGSYIALSPEDSTSPITVSGLSMGTTYSIKLRAVNRIGDGIESSPVSFTTSTMVNIEYVVIAGGGGGGQTYGAGGGAGGYRSSVSGESSGRGASAETAFSVGAGTYTVTVGGGGTALQAELEALGIVRLFLVLK